MKIYLSARYGRQAELQRVRDDLEAAGHEVVSRWIDSDDPDDLDDPVRLAEIAGENLEDLSFADCFIAFTENPAMDVPGATRGGRHVELGYVLNEMRDVAIYLVGPRENAFHSLDDVKSVFPDWRAALEALAGEPVVTGGAS